MVFMGKGDKTILTEEMAEYLYSAAGFLASRRWGLTESDREEIVQDAVCHVTRYWRYDPSRGFSWKTYASRALSNRITTLCRGIAKHRHEQIPEQFPDDSRGWMEELPELVDGLVEDQQWNRAVKLKAEGMSWKEVAKAMGRRWKDFRKPLEDFLQTLRTAMESGGSLGQPEAPPFPEPSRPVGRPSRWIVVQLDGDGNAIATYSSINKASHSLGVHHSVITLARDGEIHERKGVRWRMELKTGK